MCPVLYYYAQTTAASTEALVGFDVSTGSFGVQTDDTAKIDTVESYDITGITDAYSKTMPFSVYFEGCSDSTVVVANPYEQLAINVYLANTEEVLFGYEDFGFVSSDPVNCPLNSFSPAVTVTYCYDDGSVCTLTTYVDHWETQSQKVKVLRKDTDTVLDTAFTVRATVSFGSTAI